MNRLHFPPLHPRNADLYLGTSTVPVQEIPRPTPMASPTPTPSCTYSLEVREYGHSLTTYQLSLETLTRLVLTVGRQFAEEQAAAPAEARHALYMEIRPESIPLEGTTLRQEAI